MTDPHANTASATILDKDGAKIKIKCRRGSRGYYTMFYVYPGEKPRQVFSSTIGPRTATDALDRLRAFVNG